MRSVAINSGGGLACHLMFSKFTAVAQTMKEPRILRKTVKCKEIICIRSSDKI